jgi:hypothetical protein
MRGVQVVVTDERLGKKASRPKSGWSNPRIDEAGG